MSYILDALKKAEQERGVGQVPRLASVQDEPVRRRRGAVWLIGGALLINALVLAWWLRPVAQSKPSHPQSARAARTPVPREMQPAVTTAAPVAALTPPQTAPMSPPPPMSTPAPAPMPIAVPTEPRVQKPALNVPRHRLTRPVMPEREAPSDAPIATNTPEPATSSVPLLRDLPADFRASVPPLSLDVHVYAAANAGRFVLINMKKYREGEQLAEGPQLEAITPDGVILSYRGQRFRIARQ